VNPVHHPWRALAALTLLGALAGALWGALTDLDRITLDHLTNDEASDDTFEIRDSIAWLYAQGFPKSLDVSKAIDKAAGAARQVVSTERSPFRMADKFMGDAYESTRSGDTRSTDEDGYIVRNITAPATDAAREWQGWGTAMKPAFEPVVCARKPLALSTVAANVQTWGTGALNIDGCRIGMSDADASAINAKHAGMNVSTYDRPPGDALNLSVNHDDTPETPPPTPAPRCGTMRSKVARGVQAHTTGPLVSDVAADAIRWAKAITTAARADARKRQDRDNFRNYFEDEWIQYRFAWDNRIAPLGDHWQESIDRFKSLGLTPSDMDEAVAVAMRKDMPIDRRWRYFCGVCWNMVERRHADALEIVRAGDV
jgi:hypothetical protein